MKRRSLDPWALGVLAVVTLMAVAPPASADAYDAAITRAIAAKERALDVDEPARWEEALRLLQEADALRTTRETKYEIGFAAERLKRFDLAIEGYEAALDLGLVGAPRARAEAFLGAHAAGMARVLFRGPAGARLRVMGLLRGILPLGRPLVLFAGDSVVELSLGAQQATRKVSLSAGQVEVITLGFEAPAPSPNSPAKPAGSAAERAKPVDPPPKPTDSKPPEPNPPELRSEGKRVPNSQDAGQGLGRREQTGNWVVLGVGGVVTVGAVVLLVASNLTIDQRRRDLRGYCQQLSGADECAHAYPGMVSRAQGAVNDLALWHGLETGGWIGLGIGGVLAVTGAVLLLGDTEAAPTQEPKLGVRITPVLDTRGGGTWLGVAGSF